MAASALLVVHACMDLDTTYAQIEEAGRSIEVRQRHVNVLMLISPLSTRFSIENVCSSLYPSRLFQR